MATVQFTHENLLELRCIDDDGNEYPVNRANTNDLRQCADLCALLFKIERDFEPAIHSHYSALIRLNARKDSLVVVARDGAKVIGMITVQPVISTAQGGSVGLVEDLYVLENYRRKGIATGLITVVERWARHRGFTRIQLLTDPLDTGSHFFQSQGWKPTKLKALHRLLPIE